MIPRSLVLAPRGPVCSVVSWHFYFKLLLSTQVYKRVSASARKVAGLLGRGLVILSQQHLKSNILAQPLEKWNNWYPLNALTIGLTRLGTTSKPNRRLTGDSVRFYLVSIVLNGCGRGPLLVLVSPCFMETVVVTCKIGSFLCSLDKLLQKNVIVFFFGNKISKWRSFEKRAIFDLPLAHISLTYIRVFCSPYWFFCLTNFEKKKKNEFIRCGFSLVWDLVLILIRSILEQSLNYKMVSKI